MSSIRMASAFGVMGYGISSRQCDCVAFAGVDGALFFKSCGKDLRLGRNVTFYNPSNISIGSNVYIAYGNWFSAGDLITIGDQVLLGPYSVYASSNHTSRDGSFRYGSPDKAPISIDSGAWVAAKCTVTAGISIGKGALVGAGSVVTKDVPNRVVFAGNPGRVIRQVKG